MTLAANTNMEPQDHSLIEIILNRHSVSPKQLTNPGPDESQLYKLIEAAAAAPDHGKLRPWRFISFPNNSRASLANVFEAALLERLPAADEHALSRARGKAHRAPVLLGLILKLNADATVPHINDQIASGGAALQNMLLSAHAMGFGARALSGQAVRTKAFRDAISLESNETFLCFITIGTPKMAPRHNARPNPKTLLTQWNGASKP